MLDRHEFLLAELGHAERQLARVRRLAAQMEQRLAAEGLDELKVYEALAANKAYRQLQRDEIIFHQMWLRVHRHLDQFKAPTPAARREGELERILAENSALEKQLAAAEPPQQVPYRKPPTPGPNQRCTCGSGVKYKKCCGSPLRAAA